MTWREITAFRLVTTDAERLARFYAALGFTVGERRPIAPGEMAVLGLSGTGTRLPMTLGGQRIDLDQFAVPGHRYPADANAADLLFQHFALVTHDPDTAWSRALAAGGIPISRGGPVTLPASSGGVTAGKFRDPDGHPLEFLSFPGGDGGGGGAVDRIDHSAISVADADGASPSTRTEDWSVGDETVNHGPAQVALGRAGRCPRPGRSLAVGGATTAPRTAGLSPSDPAPAPAAVGERHRRDPAGLGCRHDRADARSGWASAPILNDWPRPSCPSSRPCAGATLFRRRRRSGTPGRARGDEGSG